MTKGARNRDKERERERVVQGEKNDAWRDLFYMFIAQLQ